MANLVSYSRLEEIKIVSRTSIEADDYLSPPLALHHSSIDVKQSKLFKFSHLSCTLFFALNVEFPIDRFWGHYCYRYFRIQGEKFYWFKGACKYVSSFSIILQHKIFFYISGFSRKRRAYRKKNRKNKKAAKALSSLSLSSKSPSPSSVKGLVNLSNVRGKPRRPITNKKVRKSVLYVSCALLT